MDLSRPQLAEKLGTGRMRIWRIEVGSTKLHIEDAPSWARALKVSTNTIVQWIVSTELAA